MAYIRAVQNGNYSAPSTWDGGVVPTTGDYACTLTNRVVLDIDTGAHLCVNQTDWVAAGGAATASFQGGFDVPDGATRVLTGSLRYDGSSSLGTNTSTTAALVFKNGSLTIDKTEYVSGYTSVASSEKNIIYFAPTSATPATLTIVTSVDVTSGSHGLNSGHYIITIRAVGATSGMMIINIPAFNLVPSYSSRYMSSVLSLSGTTGYDLNMNGNFFNGASQINNGVVYVNTSSTGLDNQKININTQTFGVGAVSDGYGIYANHVSSITFMENTTINSPAATGSTDIIVINYLRNQLLIPGTLTSSGFGRLGIGLTGGSINCGNIIQTVNGVGLLTVSGNGNTTIGDITTQGSFASIDNAAIVSITAVGLITIGDIYAPAGALYDKAMLNISGSRTSPTIIGNIDATNRYTRTGSAFVTISGSNTSTTTINGSITGSVNGSTTDLDSSALYLSSGTTNQGQFIINGNVKAGTRGPGLQLITNSQQNVTINGTVIGADYPGGATIVPAAVQSRGRRVLIKNIDTGVDGRHPVDGLFAFLDPATAYYKGIDQTGTVITLNPQTDTVPLASDVRSGVAVGDTTGTLVVPQASTVLDGVVFDNGTTGTLSIGGSGTVDLSPITSAISTVDGKVTSIKTKTDQLSFSSGKVIADASVIDYTSQLSAITSTVNAISDAVDLIDAVTSKIAFETVYSEGDPNLAQVIFKAEFNGTNGSTTINADTGQTGTNQGSPSLNTAYARTGTSSVSLSSSVVSFGDIASLNFGANDFTLEFSVNFSSVLSTSGDYAGIIGKRNDNVDFSWICYVTESKLNFLGSGTNAVWMTHPTVLSSGTWYDVAISRTGDILKFYINGVLSQVSCTGMSLSTTTAPLFIGKLSYTTSGYHMFGYLDRVRITVGTGRYNTVVPVSPPTSEYPTTLNSVPVSYKVIANCDSSNGSSIPTDLTDRLNDLRNRINAIHFIVKDE